MVATLMTTSMPSRMGTQSPAPCSSSSPPKVSTSLSSSSGHVHQLLPTHPQQLSSAHQQQFAPTYQRQLPATHQSPSPHQLQLLPHQEQLDQSPLFHAPKMAVQREFVNEYEVAAVKKYNDVLCCLCGVAIQPTPSRMCIQCLRAQVDVTEGIGRTVVLPHCKQCGRFQAATNKWLQCEMETRQFLALCLKRIRGLSSVKLADASFIWTEPHSRRVRVKIVVQKDIMRHGDFGANRANAGFAGSNGNIDSLILQQPMTVEFILQPTQCDDCKRMWTPHVWSAKVQLRQRTDHKRTFLYLEQLILKHDAHENVVGIIERPDGIDFHFDNRRNAQRFVDFTSSNCITKTKSSKQLISHDASSNSYVHKHTIVCELCPVCKDDLVFLSPKIANHHFGGISSFLLCSKVSTSLRLIDPFTLKELDIASDVFWKYPFEILLTRKNLSTFMVLNVEYADSHSYLSSSHHQHGPRDSGTIRRGGAGGGASCARRRKGGKANARHRVGGDSTDARMMMDGDTPSNNFNSNSAAEGCGINGNEGGMERILAGADDSANGRYRDTKNPIDHSYNSCHEFRAIDLVKGPSPTLSHTSLPSLPSSSASPSALSSLIARRGLGNSDENHICGLLGNAIDAESLDSSRGSFFSEVSQEPMMVEAARSEQIEKDSVSLQHGGRDDCEDGSGNSGSVNRVRKRRGHFNVGGVAGGVDGTVGVGGARKSVGAFIGRDGSGNANGLNRRGKKNKWVLCECEIARSSDLGVSGERIIVKTHIGNIIKAGDWCSGYDLRTINMSGSGDELLRTAEKLPFDVVLVKKVYPPEMYENRPRRPWTLQRISQKLQSSGGSGDGGASAGGSRVISGSGSSGSSGSGGSGVVSGIGSGFVSGSDSGVVSGGDSGVASGAGSGAGSGVAGGTQRRASMADNRHTASKGKKKGKNSSNRRDGGGDGSGASSDSLFVGHGVEDSKDMEEFKRDIEEDEEMRRELNLWRDPRVSVEELAKPSLQNREPQKRRTMRVRADGAAAVGRRNGASSSSAKFLSTKSPSLSLSTSKKAKYPSMILSSSNSPSSVCSGKGGSSVHDDGADGDGNDDVHGDVHGDCHADDENDVDHGDGGGEYGDDDYATDDDDRPPVVDLCELLDGLALEDTNSADANTGPGALDDVRAHGLHDDDDDDQDL